MSKPIIVFDPGHGGRDPGAITTGLLEKDFNLHCANIGRRLLLQAFDCTVLLTRDKDVFMSLSDRAAFANRVKADLLVSIHFNAGGGTGTESYVWNGLPATHPTRAKGAILHKYLSEYIKSLGFRDRGLKTANFAVLRETRMSAWLFEALFVDTRADAVALRKTSFREDLMNHVVRGIAETMQLKAIAPPKPKPEPIPEIVLPSQKNLPEIRKIVGITLEGKPQKDVAYFTDAGFSCFPRAFVERLANVTITGEGDFVNIKKN